MQFRLMLKSEMTFKQVPLQDFIIDRANLYSILINIFVHVVCWLIFLHKRCGRFLNIFHLAFSTETWLERISISSMIFSLGFCLFVTAMCFLTFKVSLVVMTHFLCHFMQYRIALWTSFDLSSMEPFYFLFCEDFLDFLFLSLVWIFLLKEPSMPLYLA